MAVLGVLLIIMFVVSALLMMLVILLQDDQGEGLGGLFGGGSSTPFGSRSGNVLTRFTTILGAIFLLSSFGLAWVNRTPDADDVLGAARRRQAESGSTLDWWKTDPTSESETPEAPETPPPTPSN